MATLHIDATLQDGDRTFTVTGDLTVAPDAASTPATPDAPAATDAPETGTPVDAPVDVPDPVTTPATDPASAPATTDPAAEQPAEPEQPAEQPGSGWSGRVLRRDDDQQDPDPEVSDWQQRLTDRGFTVGPVDGFFGPLTEDGVRRFQQFYGIAMTGEIDEQTFNAAA